MPILEKFIATIAPYDCINCGAEGLLLCPTCSKNTLQTPPERCYRCRAISSNYKTCKSCRSSSRLNHVWAGSDYWDTAQALVKKLKFENAKSAAEIMAGHLAPILSKLPADTLIIPVPTATSRVRERGYDQAQLLARALSKQLQLQSLSLLVRTGQTRQVGTRRTARLKQLENAFRIHNTSLVKGANILLVDDVLTTGATLEAAAKILRIAGAKHVDATVFTQA